MWNWGSICHPVNIPSIFKPAPCCWDRKNNKNKNKKSHKKSGWGYWRRNVQRAGEAMPDPRWDAAERSFCFSVYMREIDPSGLASTVCINIKSIFWLELNVPNSLHRKYFTKADKIKTDNFSLRLSHSSNLIVHIFLFSDSLLMTGNFLGSCVS